MQTFIAQNKYKLMAFIIGLYLVVDVLQHKGQTRVLFPKNFAEVTNEVLPPLSNSYLMSKEKKWTKAVNTKEQLNQFNVDNGGFECDLYFDSVSKTFDIHHDPDKNAGYKLDSLLQLYQQKKLTASIWLDIKNLNDLNASSILHSLISLRNKYHLQNRILVESPRAGLLTSFSDSGFFTSYYIPFFNPYQINETTTKFWVDSIFSVIIRARLNALSGYYFQSGFLKYYFSQYPVLTWVDKPSFSLVNSLFQRKMDADESIFILLKP